jgi:hypothetical protein
MSVNDIREAAARTMRSDGEATVAEDMSDDALALRFAAEHHPHLRYVELRGRWPKFVIYRINANQISLLNFSMALHL